MLFSCIVGYVEPRVLAHILGSKSQDILASAASVWTTPPLYLVKARRFGSLQTKLLERTLSG